MRRTEAQGKGRGGRKPHAGHLNSKAEQEQFNASACGGRFLELSCVKGVLLQRGREGGGREGGEKGEKGTGWEEEKGGWGRSGGGGGGH